MPSKNYFFHFELVSDFLGLNQAKRNEISRTNPGLCNSWPHVKEKQYYTKGTKTEI